MTDGYKIAQIAATLLATAVPENDFEAETLMRVAIKSAHRLLALADGQVSSPAPSTPLAFDLKLLLDVCLNYDPDYPDEPIQLLDGNIPHAEVQASLHRAIAWVRSLK